MASCHVTYQGNTLRAPEKLVTVHCVRIEMASHPLYGLTNHERPMKASYKQRAQHHGLLHARVQGVDEARPVPCRGNNTAHTKADLIS